MPITDFSSDEGPLDSFGCQAGLDMRIFRDIFMVIEVYKFVRLYLPEDTEGRYSQKKAYGNFELMRIHILNTKTSQYPFNE